MQIQTYFRTKAPPKTKTKGNSEMTHFVYEFYNKANKRSMAIHVLISTSLHESTLNFPLYKNERAMESS